MGLAIDAVVDRTASDQKEVKRCDFGYEPISQAGLGKDERCAQSVENVYLRFVPQALQVGEGKVGTGLLGQCLWLRAPEKRS